jgi:hypothetical protein
MRFSEPMDGQIRVRVSQSEKRLLAELARQRGTTLSYLLREGAKAFAEQVAV